MPSAARVGTPTNHGGVVVGPGIPTVLVGGLPAAVLGDAAVCPAPSAPGVTHGPSSIVGGSATVLVAGLPAARQGDRAGCGAVLLQGCPTVMIGPG